MNERVLRNFIGVVKLLILHVESPPGIFQVTVLHDGDLGWHENTTGGFNQLLDKQLHHFVSHVLCVICCDFLILGPEFDMYSDYFLPEETTLLYANLLSPFNF